MTGARANRRVILESRARADPEHLVDDVGPGEAHPG